MPFSAKTPFGRFAALVISRPGRSWTAVGLVSLCALVLALGIRIDPNMLRLLPPDHPSTQAVVDLQRAEGGVEVHTISVDGTSPEAVDAYMKDLASEIRALDSVEYVLYDIDPDLAYRIGLMQLSEEELSAIRDRVQGALNFGPAMLNPFIAAQWMDLGPITAKVRGDGPTALQGAEGTARMIVRPKGSAFKVEFAKSFMDEMNGIMARSAPESKGVKVQWIGGAFRHTVEDVESVAYDLRWTAGVSMVLVFGLIWVAFRDVRAIVMIFVPLFISNLWTFGFAALSVGTLNNFTAFFPAILVGLGVDFSIHLYSRYGELREDGSSVEAAIVGAWDKTGPPCLAAAITSGAGFCALWMADFIAFQQLGTLLAGGVVLCLLSVLTVLPLLILWRERQPATIPHSRRSGDASSFLGIRGPEFPTYRLAPMVLILVGIISVAAASTLAKVEFEYDLSELRPSGLAYADLTEKQQKLVESSYPPSVVTYDDKDELHADYVRVSQAIDAGLLPEIARVLSVHSVVPRDQTGRLALLGELSELTRHENMAYLPPPVRANLARLSPEDIRPLSVDELPIGMQHMLGARGDRHWLMLFPNGNMWDLRETSTVYEAVQRWLPERPVAGQYLALSVLYNLVRDDAPRIIGTALCMVFIITWVHMRSPRRALGATAALVAGLCWAGAGLALFRVKVSMINFVGIPILMGIGIDVVIHLLHRLSEEGPGKVIRALTTTGTAAALSSATTILSFASLSAAGNQGIRSLGLMIVLGLSLVTMAAFIAIPLGWMTTWKVRKQVPRAPEASDAG
ncbi:MAG: MMPL family transporter [Myxococcota bacterium]|nr:MMPL family transporter [Myxococcota bacterium]MEC9390812.1 MMPL family transporter [Myxococcota bacterium]